MSNRDRLSVDAELRIVAEEHAAHCRSETTLVPGRGWLCSRCDSDYATYWSDRELKRAVRFGRA